MGKFRALMALRILTVGIPFFLALPDGAFAQTVNATDGVALGGYDPVAYFAAGAPAKGSAAHSVNWRGAEWRFASAQNRDRFAAAPETYAPQYGGFCAYGISQGAKVGFDPNAWRIVDGKLYLNLNADVQKTWLEDIPGYIQLADQKWPQLKDRKG